MPLMVLPGFSKVSKDDLRGPVTSWPVFSREVKGFLRSRKAFWCLFLFLTGLLLFLLDSWGRFAGAWILGETQSINPSLAGKLLFHNLARGQLFILTILTPFLTAPAIAGECERGTLGLLVSSPVSLSRILFQKLVSSMAFLVLLLLGAAPVMALCFLAGGLSGQEVAGAYIILISASLLYGSVGLFCSAFFRHVYEVYLLAFGLIFFFAIILPYHASVWHYITKMSWENRPGVLGDWDWFSPFAALGHLLFPETSARTWGLPLRVFGINVQSSGPGQGEFLLGGPVLSFALISGTIALVCFAVARWRMWHVVEGPGPRKESLEEIQESSSFVNEDVKARGVAVKSGMFDEDHNPVYLLEQRVQWLGHIDVMLRLLYVALMISIITLPLASFKGSWLFLSLPYLAAALFTVPLAATAVSSEYERNTLDMLRVTMLTPQNILLAKYRTSFLSSLILALTLYLPGMVVVMIAAWFDYDVDLIARFSDLVALMFYPLLLISSLFFYTSISLYCSVKYPKSNVALLVSSLLVLGFILVPLFCVHLFSGEAPSNWNDSGESMVSLLSSSWGTLPFILASPLTIISSLFPSGSINLMGLRLSHPFTEVAGAGILFLLVHCVLVVLAGWWLLRHAARTLVETSETYRAA